MRNIAPNRDNLDANFFAPNSASHAEDKHYLLSSKGSRLDDPLPKVCGNFNGVDNIITIPQIASQSSITVTFYYSALIGNGDVLEVNATFDKLISINGILTHTGITTGATLTVVDFNTTWKFATLTIPNHNAAVNLKIGNGTFKFYDLVLQGLGQWYLEESVGNTTYDSSSNGNHGTIQGDLTNFWYQGSDIPYSYANKLGYTLNTLTIIPAISPITDVLGNPLTNPGAVRHKAKVIDVNVGNIPDILYQIQFSAFPVGFTFTNEGTVTGVAIDATGLLTVTGVGTIFDLKIYNGATLIHHYSFNEGQGDIVYDLVGNNNGTWIGHTDPNQWGKSDEAIDYSLVNRQYKKSTVFSSVDLGNSLNNWRHNTSDATIEYVVGTGIVFTGSSIHSGTPTILQDADQYAERLDDTLKPNTYYCDITYDYVEAINPANVVGFRIRLKASGVDISGTVVGLTPGNNNTLRVEVVSPTELYSTSILDRITLYISFEHQQAEGAVVTVKSAVTNVYYSDKYIFKGLVNTGSKIDFNPFGALGADVPRAYEPQGLVPSGANMYMNQTFIPSAIFSTEADAVITNMEIREPYERQFVAEFVEELKTQGNYNLIDEQMLMGLRHGAGLKMMKGTVIPVNNGAVYIEGVGYDFNGISSYIDSNYSPGINGINYKLTDNLFGGFVNQAIPKRSFLIGYDTTANGCALWDNGNNVLAQINTNGGIHYTGNRFEGKNLYLGFRENDNRGIKINGNTVVEGVVSPAGITNIGLRIGSGAGADFFDGIISSFIIGAAIGFDHLSYYNSLTKVQTKIELGAVIKDILIYNNELKTADDVRRLHAYINDPIGTMNTMSDLDAEALDRLYRNLQSTE